MTKGRTTTYKERIEIIKYCIENENNYAETAEKYRVSYQQVYSWIRKYQTQGIEALQDGRGKRKKESEMVLCQYFGHKKSNFLCCTSS